MKRFLILSATSLLTLALAGGREPMPMNMDHSAHAGMPMTGMTMPGMSMNMQAMNARDLAALKPLKGRAFDIKFAQLMIDHHQMALHMAQYVLKYGQDAWVKQDAQQVMTVQQKEIDLMVGWLKGWGAPLPMSQTHQVNMTMPRMTGSADRWYVTEMIPHHQGAVDMANLALKQSKNPELIRLATAISRDQTDGIKLYREWLKTIK